MQEAVPTVSVTTAFYQQQCDDACQAITIVNECLWQTWAGLKSSWFLVDPVLVNICTVCDTLVSPPRPVPITSKWAFSMWRCIPTYIRSIMTVCQYYI